MTKFRCVDAGEADVNAGDNDGITIHNPAGPFNHVTAGETEVRRSGWFQARLPARERNDPVRSLRSWGRERLSTAPFRLREQRAQYDAQDTHVTTLTATNLADFDQIAIRSNADVAKICEVAGLDQSTLAESLVLH